MKCPKCNGAKKISDLGFVKKTCPECLGVGHVKDIEIETPVATVTAKNVKITSSKPKLIDAISQEIGVL